LQKTSKFLKCKQRSLRNICKIINLKTNMGMVWSSRTCFDERNANYLVCITLDILFNIDFHIQVLANNDSLLCSMHSSEGFTYINIIPM
jgi:hypothetical protein